MSDLNLALTMAQSGVASGAQVALVRTAHDVALTVLTEQLGKTAEEAQEYIDGILASVETAEADAALKKVEAMTSEARAKTDDKSKEKTK